MMCHRDEEKWGVLSSIEVLKITVSNVAACGCVSDSDETMQEEFSSCFWHFPASSFCERQPREHRGIISEPTRADNWLFHLKFSFVFFLSPTFSRTHMHTLSLFFRRRSCQLQGARGDVSSRLQLTATFSGTQQDPLYPVKAGLIVLPLFSLSKLCAYVAAVRKKCTNCNLSRTRHKNF